MEMRRFFILSIAIGTALGCFLLYGCDDEPCAGFEAEPYFLLHADSLNFKVYCTNNETGDTVHTNERDFALLPFDMNATQMKYDIYAPDFKGSLILDYILRGVECDYRSKMLLGFDHLSVNESSTFRDFYTLGIYQSKYSGIRIDSIENLADFFTPYSYGDVSNWTIRL
jgi:hypothetical protein